ncbi:MAG TPA: dihydroorotate dehydrogenase [Oscillospiraceae bacterium]|nr:dihydroorotate dehydrogenase [Oscillospiraceae bacterium]
MVDLSVSLGGLALRNPLIPASGCCGYGLELMQFYDLNLLGAIAVKGTTAEARFGNEQPRIAECPAGMLNAVGLQNPGIDAVLSEELPALRAAGYRGIVLLNVGGFSAAEYAAVCRKADADANVAAVELNISCPNVHAGGMAFGTEPGAAFEVVSAVRKAVAKPLFVKLTPNVTDIVAVARACEDAGADGLCLINTILGMRIDLRRRAPVLANVYGGLSGPAVFPVALRMVHQVTGAVKLPVIGMGGVSSADDVLEMLMAGASAVEVGAANLVRPTVCRDILAELPGRMEELGLSSLRGLRV